MRGSRRATMRPACGLVLGFALAIAVNPHRAAAQQAPCLGAPYRAFDFWIGTWDVIGANGSVAGRNVITAGNNGCTIHESYSTPRGYTGQSINAFDASRNRWHQTWSDNSGLLLLLDGESPRPGVMVLQGARRDGQGREILDRITWTANADGSVRQHWENSSDGGATWTTSFDGRYVRVGQPDRR